MLEVVLRRVPFAQQRFAQLRQQRSPRDVEQVGICTLWSKTPLSDAKATASQRSTGIEGERAREERERQTPRPAQIGRRRLVCRCEVGVIPACLNHPLTGARAHGC